MLLYTGHSVFRCFCSEPGNEYLPLIQHLIKDVEDINAIALPKRNEKFPYPSSGTVFDLYAHSLYCCYNFGKSHSRVVLDRTILNLLRSKGAELSKPIDTIEQMTPTHTAEHFKTETSLLRHIPEEVERKILLWVSLLR